MTREYILQNLEVMCPIMFIDNPGLRDYVMSTLQDSLLIPKPKFKVGDRVTDEFGDKHYIDECCYDLSKNRWWYLSLFGNKYYEHELEIVEEKNETN